MQVYENSQCCGCRVCAEACPTHSIEMRNDQMGFCYPKVDGEKCLSCKICRKVCPTKNSDRKESLAYYVGFASDSYVRQLGSSGGLFGAIARYVIDRKGIVFAAGFDSDLQLRAMKAESIEELIPLYRSKYVHCDMSGSYRKVKSELGTGRWVLFCSTPCNCQALRNYLKRDYETLVLVDFVCHGVSSQKLFDECIHEYEKKNGKVVSFDFRSKEHDLNCSRVCKIATGQSESYKTYLEFPYYYYYYMGYNSFRPNCYECGFATDKRCTDITLGDYAFPMRFFQKENRLKGCSSIICTTLKGKEIIESLPLTKVSVGKDVIVSANECLQHPTYSAQHEMFAQDYGRMTFDDLLKKYGYYSLQTKLKRAYYAMPFGIQNFIRKIIIRG